MSRLNRVKAYCKKNNITIFTYIWQFALSKKDELVKRIKNVLRDKYIDNPNQARLKNIGPTIISINCNGGTISHDLGQRFNSPFVNLWLTAKDFLKYCENMDYYNTKTPTFIKEDGIDYPIGLLDDIKLYFMHYHTEEEALEKWVERTKRINKDNMFFMMTDQETVLEDIERFDRLPFENKVIFTHIPMPEIKSSFYIKGFENDVSVGKLNGWEGRFSIRKYYDQFDYVDWFNKNIK